ncbi:hypothetical protein Taro_051425 [Colocasia esculenta]|uniref:Uncharacterized protein n=1 Tax=Colocasia esculenta TaxID=4460 RepID=A0A843XGR1_COLES|nr:hypothetical protein [Colocasia esculenta]
MISHFLPFLEQASGIYEKLWFSGRLEDEKKVLTLFLPHSENATAEGDATIDASTRADATSVYRGAHGDRDTKSVPVFVFLSAQIDFGHGIPIGWFLVVSALLVMAHAYGGIRLCQSLSLPPLSRFLPLPHLRCSLPLPPLKSFLSLPLLADSSLFHPSGLFDGICIFCSRSICIVCTVLGEGH